MKEVNRMDLIQILKALSDETRVRLLYLLSAGELCVCELEAVLDISQSNASRHLNKLTSAGLVSYEKVNKYVYYKLNARTLEQYQFLKPLLEQEFMKLAACQTDLAGLKSLKRDGMSCETLKTTNRSDKNEEI
jgi:ArsR family transcriptional regulator, arsenate/arsenite/antimonite-responsive transcriptional repressor